MNSYYGVGVTQNWCAACGTTHNTTATADPENSGLKDRVAAWYKVLDTAFDSAIRYIHSKGQYETDYLAAPKVRALVTETNAYLQEAQKTGLADSVIPAAMQKSIDTQLFVFSGCKTEKQLREAGALLRDSDDKIKPFATFKKDVQAIHTAYNEQYLEAEYLFAVRASQAAAKWAQFAESGDRYDLQYRTAQDNRVRQSHSVLAGTTLPFDDPFWDKYFTPNGWRCRCVVVQVRKGKYTLSDSKKSIALGDAATNDGRKADENRLAIFRFNPGKQAILFPPHHPYLKEQKRVAEALALKDTAADYKLLRSNKSFNTALDKVTDDMRKLHPDLADEQIAAVWDYTADFYISINSQLRKGKLDDFHTVYARVLNSALNKIPDTFGTSKDLFRGASLSQRVLETYIKHYKDKTPSIEMGFTSTSTEKDVAKSFVDLRKGEWAVNFIIKSKSARDINSMSKYKNEENEYLIPASKAFKVLDIKKSADTLTGNDRFEIHLIEWD